MLKHGVTFNVSPYKMCSSPIFETYFSYHKDGWTEVIYYYIYFYLIVLFIAFIHPIQWTIVLPVSATGPAKRQQKMSCIYYRQDWSWSVHSLDGASYFLPVQTA